MSNPRVSPWEIVKLYMGSNATEMWAGDAYRMTPKQVETTKALLSDFLAEFLFSNLPSEWPAEERDALWENYMGSKHTDPLPPEVLDHWDSLLPDWRGSGKDDS